MKRSAQSAPRLRKPVRGVIIGCAVMLITMGGQRDGRFAFAARSPYASRWRCLSGCSGAFRHHAERRGRARADRFQHALSFRGSGAAHRSDLRGLSRTVRTLRRCGAASFSRAGSGSCPRPSPAEPMSRLFVSHAVIREFSGPPASPGVARSLAALAKVLAPRARGSVSGACRIGAAQLVDIGLRISLDELRNPAADDIDFTIDSTRFMLGQMYLFGGQWSAVWRDDPERQWHAARCLGRHRGRTLPRGRAKSEPGWSPLGKRRLPSRREPPIVIAAEAP